MDRLPSIPISAPSTSANVPRWSRAPEHERRIGRGDDFAGDAWRHARTGHLRWVAVGRDPNAAAEDGSALPG